MVTTYLSFDPIEYLFFFSFRHCFEPASSFLPQFLFFFKAQSSGDFVMLVETCRLLRQFAHSCGILQYLFMFLLLIPVGQFVLGADQFAFNSLGNSCVRGSMA